MIGFFYAAETNIKGIRSIDLDATLDEAHEWSNEVTSNPVETGAPVTDHVIEKPDKLSITGLITNSPLHGSLAGQYFGGETQSQRIQTVFEAIYDLTKRRETVTVYTRHAVYNNMVIQSVNIPRSASIGEAIEFKMELVHIRMVSTQMVTLPPGISAKPAAKSTAAVAKKTEPQKTTGKTENVDLAKKRDVSGIKAAGEGFGEALKDLKGLYK
jgi:hypothetical protein